MSAHTDKIATVDGKSFDVYLESGHEAPKPAIIIFTPIFGVNNDMMGVAQRWQDRGYLVALPDYFFRVNPGVIDHTTEDGRRQAHARWHDFDPSQVVQDMGRLKTHLQNLPACNGAVLSIGFCAGGELAFLCAARLGIEATATFHATDVNKHLDEAESIRGRLTMHYGDNDRFVSVAQVEAIRQRFSGNSRVDIHLYEGAEHGFTLVGRHFYHEAAAIASDQRAQDVFNNY